MTYQELISEIKNLGFGDDSEVEEFQESNLLYEATNRAITTINLNVAPIIAKYEFDVDDDDEGYQYITMSDVDSNFLDFTDTPVLFEKDDEEMYTKWSDYDIEMGDTVVINMDDCKGSFRIFYKKAHDPFTSSTSVTTAIPLPLRVHHLVPMLAAYYVWLEDEPAKAAQYYNLYEQKVAEITEQENRPKGRIWTGGI